MIHTTVEGGRAKGWLAGPWNSPLPIPIGYAHQGIAELHRHRQMGEVYLVARGTCVALVEGREVRLGVGDMLAVAPGEAHTFGESSPDYLHFVLQVPFVAGDKEPL